MKREPERTEATGLDADQIKLRRCLWIIGRRLAWIAAPLWLIAAALWLHHK